ncbi:hypothetical protein M0P65_04815 [Candidatus Gracilibacteria bacterium]|nr:hypothetical protein [Candidatus Gracilibacteria bacterium]
MGNSNTPSKGRGGLRGSISKNELVMAKATQRINEILADLGINSIKEFSDYLTVSGYNMNSQTDKIGEFEKILYTGSWAELIKHLKAIYRKPEGRGKYARLTSGLISDGYVNFGATERDFRVLERASNELAGQIIKQKEKIGKIDVIMGAQMGSVRISSFLGKALNVNESIYAEKDGENLILKRHDINLKGKNVILSEDVITKGSTLAKMIELVEKRGGKVTAITCVVNRSGKDNYNGIPIYTCYIPEKFGMYYDDTSVRKNFEEILRDRFDEEFTGEVMWKIPENISGYKKDDITIKENLLKIFKKIKDDFDRNELIKITNKVFDKFEKDGILPFPKKGKVEENPKANWSELVSVM